MARNNKGDGGYYRDPSRGRWIAEITADGTRYRRVAKTKPEAAAKLEELRRSRDDGSLSRTKPPTLNAWLEHWLDNVAELAPRTLNEYRGYIARYVHDGIGKKRLDQLDLEHVDRLFAAMRKGTHKLPNGKTCRPLSAATRHQMHAILNAALKAAKQRGKINRNIMDDIEAPRIEQRKTKSLTEAEALKLSEAADKDEYGARWHLALSLGLRPSEALGLAWDMVDLDAGEIHIERQMLEGVGNGARIVGLLKSDSSRRTLPLPEYVTQSLIKHRQRQLQWMVEAGESWKTYEQDGQILAPCFTHRNGSPIFTRYDSTKWKQFLEAAGVGHERRYIARHTCASILVANGCDIALVASILGHANAAFTARTYVHPFEERKKEAMRGLESFRLGKQ